LAGNPDVAAASDIGAFVTGGRALRIFAAGKIRNKRFQALHSRRLESRPREAGAPMVFAAGGN
jgi:hypothetical protein